MHNSLKKTRIIALASLVAVALLGTSATHAQPALGGEAPKGDREARIVEKLGLTPEQADQLREAIGEHREARKALHDKYAGHREAAREEMRALRESHRDNLASFLSEDQMGKLKKMMKHRAKKAREFRKGKAKGEAAPE